MAKYEYRVRREFLELPEQRHDELIVASKPAWYSCSIAIYAGAALLPLCFAIGLALAMRTLLSPLPKSVGIAFTVGVVFILYFGPKFLFRLSKHTTLHCMQAACLRLFAKQRARSG
jgi:hypothetical protein